MELSFGSGSYERVSEGRVVGQICNESYRILSLGQAAGLGKKVKVID